MTLNARIQQFRAFYYASSIVNCLLFILLSTFSKHIQDEIAQDAKQDRDK
jgi:hypothetical protein